MRPRDRGTIVQVGSALGYRAIPLQSAYCGAKHAVNGFTESVRCELLHDDSNVRITVVQMPAVNTPQFSWVRSRLPRQPQPVPPIYQPEVAAQGVVFAADHPDRKEYWVGGSTAATIFGPEVRRRRCSTATWPAPATTRSRRSRRPTPASRPTCGSRSTRRRAATTARTATSTTGPAQAALSSTPPRPQREQRPPPSKRSAGSNTYLQKARSPATSVRRSDGPDVSCPCRA